MPATDAGGGEPKPPIAEAEAVRGTSKEKGDTHAAASTNSQNLTIPGGGGGGTGGGGVKSAGKSPGKSVKRHGQEESDEEGEVKDAGTPVGNRDLRLDIGM